MSVILIEEKYLENLPLLFFKINLILSLVMEINPCSDHNMKKLAFYVHLMIREIQTCN